MHKLILIEKDSPSSVWWKNLVSSKRIAELSVKEVVNKYQGFEGELISFFLITENKSKLNELINQCFALKQLSDCLLLFVISNTETTPSFLKELAVRVGYDIGVCEEEKTIYSSIYNEVLFGNLDELVSYKDLLNKNFLFPDKFLAEKYVALHNELSAQGKGVEDYEKMTIYEIWKIKDNTTSRP